MMSSLPVKDAQNNLQEIIDQVAEQGKPVIIRGDRGNAILLAEKDWSAIQETLYLLSIPGMRESIKEGLATPIQECDGELYW
ncbi:MAG: type II toxin-antitoxin system Phd/YefM family antitoxin [Nostoc sp. CmiVER01]|uniref:type II toxin-antitoxin system Phd/YefM family antitoxin n=2 Tax=unclassified Nostoc TaxID=2593658 RepID=UPI002AD3EDCD|nr:MULTISPECIES: type II toxin-antitoxin system Phd/YefM family antitoxin [unclassified Nostoc]MDZ8125725.1 type II toxin-antitoxin system Phd/YefM family antitoxin [Nostoc sp. CmiVER01]MDZ8224353.1 type II toxin-antitoxin system Phd/YefM family antitoxin [Nostoc sp. ChiVER01]